MDAPIEWDELTLRARLRYWVRLTLEEQARDLGMSVFDYELALMSLQELGPESVSAGDELARA
jgi:hypothetical protein